MIRGIDVSNWQNGLKQSDLPIDFCICKATEGIGFTDPSCDEFIQDCIRENILWGFYHFARENSPEEEAEYFYNECKNYFGHGIPVLDYETSNYDDTEWCERFMSTLYDLSDVWAMLYISASRCPDFEGSFIPMRCGLWVAGYPYVMTDWPQTEMPYNITPWEFAAIWQFSSSLILPGYCGKLDGDIAYMDSEAWSKYAGAETPEPQPQPVNPPKTCEQLAEEVIAGKWGNGWNREQALNSAYGDGTYEHVQAIVNRKLDKI